MSNGGFRQCEERTAISTRPESLIVSNLSFYIQSATGGSKIFWTRSSFAQMMIMLHKAGLAPLALLYILQHDLQVMLLPSGAAEQLVHCFLRFGASCHSGTARCRSAVYWRLLCLCAVQSIIWSAVVHVFLTSADEIGREPCMQAQRSA